MRLSLILVWLDLWASLEVSLSQNGCSLLPIVPHGFVSEETKKTEYHEGHLIHFTCETGYISGPTIRYNCTRTGWKAIRRGSCYLKPCPLPDDTPNGYFQITHGKDFVFGTTIQYFCYEGYQMVGRATTRTCLSDGWTNRVPICEPLSCDLPPADAGIIVKGLPDNDETVLPDRFLTFSCDDPGKHLNGSSTLICGKDGQWDHPFPTCEDITCKIAAVPPALTVVGLPQANEIINIGHKLRFHCSDDNLYTLEGTEEVQCLETGEWNNPFPTCSEKCQVPYVPINVATTSSYGTYVRGGQKLRFTCQLQGQFLQGKNEVTCLRNGKWSDPFPKCGAPLGCGQAPPLIDGDIKFSVKFTHQNNEQVRYTCKRYYILEGTPFKTCVNGEWRGDIRCLKPCTVDREVMNKHHVEFKYRRDDKLYSSHNDEIEFRCQYGRRHVGNLLMRQTCLEGVIHIPTCQ
ncbi:complement factor H-like [Aulostomus maculatus]